MSGDPLSRLLHSSPRQRRLSATTHEGQPLLSQTDHDQRYDGVRGNEETNEASPPLTAIQTCVNRLRKCNFRWPTLISITVTGFLTLAILLVVFITPENFKEYAKEAISIEPTKLSVDSFTATGIKFRIQADIEVDSSKVLSNYLRSLGRLSTSIVKKVGIKQSEVNIYLPDYDNGLSCIATLPKLVVDVRNGHKTSLDFPIDVALKDIKGIQRVINDWLEGGLDQVRILAKADVSLTSGLISLKGLSISEFITFEGGNSLPIPHYFINKLNLHETPIYIQGKEGLAVYASIFIENNQPVELDIPALAFDVLVQGCDKEQLIGLVSVTTGSTHLYYRSGALLEVNGIIPKLPESLLVTCPESDLSPLDLLIANYIGGNSTTVFIRGSNSSTHKASDWISKFLTKITVPITVPAQPYHDLIRNFSITDTKLSLPDMFAQPGSDGNDPHLSGRIMAIADIPKEVKFGVNISKARANVDVYHRGAKFGELNLYNWQEVECELLERQNDTGSSLKIQSYVNNVPLKITDKSIFADVVTALIFKKQAVLLGLVALVDVQILSVLGTIFIKDIPAETTVPIKL